MPITPTSAAITASNGRKPKRWRPRIANAAMPVITRRKSGDPEQELEADRGAEELGQVGRHRDHLAWTQSRTTCARENCSRQTSGRLRPVAMPSFADSVWISIAIRFEATITQTSV